MASAKGRKGHTMAMPNKRAKRWTQLDRLIDEYAEAIREVERVIVRGRNLEQLEMNEDNARGALTDFLRSEGL